eukprot:CAMPEP_0117525874 /NCGR_PEP_ID=MMETSP0784-20121206/35998_1 /TAXON_ID=39447 /ORGANISM="" /LENGTH=162 /DNA_ID=CAMNT_0005322091 /DNA_START=259 /DNA_END=745 /DNA_ORIENTATION=+
MNGPTDVANEAMEKIVPKAAKANRARGVTGQLSYDAALQQVWQVLEGDSDAVAFLWERIQVDSRHVIDMDTVLIETVDARTFPLGWGLKLRTRGMDIDEVAPDVLFLRRDQSCISESCLRIIALASRPDFERGRSRIQLLPQWSPFFTGQGARSSDCIFNLL